MTFALAVAVSVVHYVDNVIRFDQYAKNPATPVTLVLVPVSWVVFTVAGMGGYLLFRRARPRPACYLLPFYSIIGSSGLATTWTHPPSPPAPRRGQAVGPIIRLRCCAA